MTPVVQGRRGAAERARLRRLIRRIESRPTPRATPAPSRGIAPHGLHLAQERTTPLGGCVFLEQRFPLTTRIGRQSLAGLRGIDGPLARVLAPREPWDGPLGRLVFLDIEATGLHGAGVVAFLIGTAVIEGDSLILRQYLARTPAEEGAALAALLADIDLASDPVLVTYNGRSYDAPVLDDRATMHRLRGGFTSVPHLDLLPAARLIFRDTVGSCRLKALEPAVLAFDRGEDDVPGGEVPAWYFRYVRTGDPRHLVPLVRHNAHDVLALGALLAAMRALVGQETPASAEQALGLGRLNQRAGEGAAAIPWLERAVGELERPLLRREAQERLASAYKAQGGRARAVPLWEALSWEAGPGRLWACVELAKYWEHEARDFGAAVEVTERALAITREMRETGGCEALEHRLDRLRRRSARAGAPVNL